MKKLFSLVVAGSAICLLLSACKKPAEPEPDPYSYSSDLQSTKDACFAMLTVSDIEMCMSFVAEGNMTPYFYMPMPPVTISVMRDTVNKYMFVSYNNTLCRDGKTRDGTIAMNYGVANPNAKYYRDFEFSGKITLINYKINNWEISNITELMVTNKRPSNFNPATGKLSWRINGKIRMKHLLDNSEITWDGDVTKILDNTNNPAVFTGPYTPIDWRPARLQYIGEASGNARGSLGGYSYSALPDLPPLRDFACSFVPAANPAAILHPFNGGGATIKSSNYHPRIVYYGAPHICDNSGTVSFHTETYPIDFEP